MRNTRGRSGWLVLLGMVLLGLVVAGVAGAQTTKRVSVASGGAQGNGSSGWPAVSGDGRYVTFHSNSDNLVPNDNNGKRDALVYDTWTNEIRLPSQASNGTQGNDDSFSHVISADGRIVAYGSTASNLVPGGTNGKGQIFVNDQVTGATTLLSQASDGTQGNDDSGYASLSANGRFVAFQSAASNLVPGDNNGYVDIFVRDRTTGETSLVSVASDGTLGNGNSEYPSISGDGRFVAFQSAASNLVAGDTNGITDIFVHDRWTKQTTRVNVANDGRQGNEHSWRPAISGNGRWVAYESWSSNLVPDDTNDKGDIFVYDTATAQTTRVSVDSDGRQGNDFSWRPKVSNNGRWVTFDSSASNLVPGDTNGHDDVFVHDRTTGQTTRVSVASDGTQGDNASRLPAISGCGTWVAFQSTASNLVPGDTNGVMDVFVCQWQGAPPPMLAATRPVRNAVQVRRRDPIVVTFSQPVVMGSAEQRCSVHVGHNSIPGKIDWLRAFTTMRFTPDNPLPAQVRVAVNLSTGIRCKDGTVFNRAENFSFTTGGEPVVNACGPRGDKVGTGAAIRVTFDQPMHRISVQRNLSCQPTITGTYSWVGRTLTFTPAAPLTPGTKYRVRVGPKARSATGNELGRPYEHEFTTAGTPPPPPSAVSVVAASTSNGAAVTVNLSAAASVQVQVLNIAGRPVALLPEQSLTQGLSTLNWNGMTTLGTKAPAGTYLVRVTARGAEGTQSQALTTLNLQR